MKPVIRNYATARVVFTNAGAADRVASIDIYGQIGSDFWEEGIDPLQFKQDLAALEDHEVLEVRMHSYGGYVYEGQAIATTLRRHKAEKHIFVDGMAASMASVILMAGDKRYIAKNGTIMIHNPIGVAFGDNEKIRSYLASMDTIKEQIIESYAEVTGLSNEELSELMNAETYFTASQALEKGLVDEIGDEIQVDIEDHISADADLSFLNQDGGDERQRIAASVRSKISPVGAFLQLSGNTEKIQEQHSMNKDEKNSGADAGNEGETQITAEAMATAVANATAAEGERINGIQDLSQPGVEDIVAECVKDTTCSLGDAAIKVSLALKALNTAKGSAELETRKDEGNGAVNDQADDHEIHNGADEEIDPTDYKAQFEANLNGCADEFLDVDHYVAYKNALEKGSIKHTSNLSQVQH